MEMLVVCRYIMPRIHSLAVIQLKMVHGWDIVRESVALVDYLPTESNLALAMLAVRNEIVHCVH